MAASTVEIFEATLGAIARLEVADVRPTRLTEPEFAKWARFRRKLGWCDFIRLLHEDLAEAFPEPFDITRWGLDPFENLEEATAKALLDKAATPAKAQGPAFLKDQAQALGVASGGSLTEVPKIQARHKVLELPGAGGRIAAHQCASHGLAYDKNFTFVADSLAERVLIGLGAVELRANAPTIIDLAGLDELIEKDAKFDRVVGLKGSKTAVASEAYSRARGFTSESSKSPGLAST